MSTQAQRLIPIQPGRESPLRPVVLTDDDPELATDRTAERADASTSAEPTLDTRGRILRDLRISVIDQCNLRCGYCMPREVFNQDYVFLSRSELLSFGEMERLVSAFVGLGVEKVRITGGEPLLRRGLEDLVGRLATLTTLHGQPLELALTTNGLLLAQKADALASAGLHRVTVSLDALDPIIFRQMAGHDQAHPETVLEGIQAAQAAGLKVKANMVIQRGINDQEVLPMAQRFRALGVTLRFIEFMDVGSSNGWTQDRVVPSQEILDQISAVFPLQFVGRDNPSEVSERYAYEDGQGQIGFISSVSQPFCGHCSRARISAEGGFYTCLFAQTGHDLRGLVREEASDARLLRALRQLWGQRADRYSELRAELMEKGPQQRHGPKIEMSYIGG